MKSMSLSIAIYWLRRDLRLHDNHALYQALEHHENVLPLFIFDEEIIDELPKDDHRITFIYNQLKDINEQLLMHSSSLLCLKGQVDKVWQQLIQDYTISDVYLNEDYEPYGIDRDKKLNIFFDQHHIKLHSYKDQVIFAKDEVLKNDGLPYTVFTPYKNKWLRHFTDTAVRPFNVKTWHNMYVISLDFPSLDSLGFVPSKIKVRPYDIHHLGNYDEARNVPSSNGTSHLGVFLRFGVVSIREIISSTMHNAIFLNELIWREFFMQILYHFPRAVTQNFKPKYDNIQWVNNFEHLERWQEGTTGYPFVDAGMRELNKTGYMHNRVRMIAAGFLCKHLLIDWRYGEAYFAQKLFDYELSSNNGNWQWAAGCGCDAAPYFRIFNPIEQLKKFDTDLSYVKRWIPEFGSEEYPEPIVEHKWARLRALEIYKAGINST